jgi:hypothetical protein
LNNRPELSAGPGVSVLTLLLPEIIHHAMVPFGLSRFCDRTMRVEKVKGQGVAPKIGGG